MTAHSRPETMTDAPVSLEELPLMLTVNEMARVLRISRNGAYAAVADGAIPSLRIGRTIRIPRRALADLLERRSDFSNPEGLVPSHSR